MQYLPHSNILCLTYGDFVRPGICESKGTYDSLKNRGQIKVHGRSSLGSGILIEYVTLPAFYKERVDRVYVNVYDYMLYQPLMNLARMEIMHIIKVRCMYPEKPLSFIAAAMKITKGQLDEKLEHYNLRLPNRIK